MFGRVLGLGALLALLCGCATIVVREEPSHAALVEALIENVKGTTVQMVEGAWKDVAFAAECVLKGDGEMLTAVLLAPQMRLATLTLKQPHTLRWDRAPQVPSSLDPEYVLFDMALVLLPTATLSEKIGEDYRVDETADGRRRRVVDARGRLHSVRQVLPDGGVYFRNAVYGYELTVKTISHEN